MTNISDPIKLRTPVVRGSTTIESVRVREPNSGELRQVSLIDLLRSDVASLIMVLPRLTMPSLTKHELENMRVPDLFRLSVALSRFLGNEDEEEMANDSDYPTE